MTKKRDHMLTPMDHGAAPGGASTLAPGTLAPGDNVVDLMLESKSTDDLTQVLKEVEDIDR